MSVRIIDNTPKVLLDTTQNANLFLRLMADEVVRNSTPNTPKRTGDLRNTVLRQVLGLKGKVMWTRKYAAIMETKQFRNYTTPGTGPHYAEDAIEPSVAKTEQIAKQARLI